MVKNKSFIINSGASFKHCVDPPFPDGGRVESPTEFSERGGLIQGGGADFT